MKKILDKPYEQDEFFKKWLIGLSPRTKENYTTEYHEWHVFIGLTPTEQIKKRMHDLTTEDLTQRLFFEEKLKPILNSSCGKIKNRSIIGSGLCKLTPSKNMKIIQICIIFREN